MGALALIASQQALTQAASGLEFKCRVVRCSRYRRPFTTTSPSSRLSIHPAFSHLPSPHHSIWDVSSGRRVSHGGAGPDGTAYWRGGSQGKEPQHHAAPVIQLALGGARTSRLAAATEDSVVRLYDASTLCGVGRLRHKGGPLRAMRFAASGKRV